MSPKVSVIVPIYNEEERLERCLDSIVNQTLKDIEIILVDDGSTDRSPEIIASYAARDNRIIVMRTERERQNRARRYGWTRSTGEYVGFVDADDYIDRTAYEKAYACAKRQDVDICIFGYDILRSSSKEASTITTFYRKRTQIRKWAQESPHARNLLPPETSFALWSRIYKRSLLSFENFFPEITFKAEDFATSIQIFYRCRSIALLPESLYTWDIRNTKPTRMRTYVTAAFYIENLYRIAAGLQRWCRMHRIHPRYARTTHTLEYYLRMHRHSAAAMQVLLPIVKKHYHLWYYVWDLKKRALVIKYICTFCFRAYFGGRISSDSRAFNRRLMIFHILMLFCRAVQILHHLIYTSIINPKLTPKRP